MKLACMAGHPPSIAKLLDEPKTDSAPAERTQPEGAYQCRTL